MSNLFPPSVSQGSPGGGGGSGSPAQVVFTVGSPPSGSTPPFTSRQRKYSGIVHENMLTELNTSNSSPNRICSTMAVLQ